VQTFEHFAAVEQQEMANANTNGQQVQKVPVLGNHFQLTWFNY
jgi:hypothetical protein